MSWSGKLQELLSRWKGAAPETGERASAETSAPEHAPPPDYEAILRRIYEAVLTPGDTAIDVGAHLGDHAVPMAQKVGPGGRVHAFEPLPSVREQLAAKLERDFPELKEIVRLYPTALSHYEGEAEFVVAKDLPAYSGLKERTYDHPTELERIAVPVRRLEFLIDELESLAFVKVDAEGGEYDVFRGAVAVLEKFRPPASFEFGANSLGEYGITPTDMARFWTERRYRVFDILGRELDEAQFARSAEEQSVWDYAAIPEEKPELERRIRAEVWARL